MSEDEFVDFSEEGLPTIADLAAYAQSRNGAGDYEPDESWVPINLVELPDKPPVEPTLGGLGIVYPGKRHVFSGPQESAKTLAAYVIGLSVIRQGGSVVLIDFEMGKWDAKTRLRELGATDDDLAKVLYVAPATPATQSTATTLVEAKPELVIVDASAGAFDIQGLDDNRRQDVERFIRLYVRGFWEAGIATIVLDHVTKNAESRGNYAIGSERKVGVADVHLGFEVVHAIKRGGNGLYKVVLHKDRVGWLKRGKLCEFVLESDPDTHQISWEFKAPVELDDDAEFRPTHIMEKVSRYLETLDEPVSKNAIEKQKLGKHDYVRLALEVLVREGYVDERSGPRSSRLYESLTIYREAFDNTSPPLRPDFAPGSDETSSSHIAPYYVGGEDEFVDEKGGTTSPPEQFSTDDIPW